MIAFPVSSTAHCFTGSGGFGIVARLGRVDSHSAFANDPHFSTRCSDVDVLPSKAREVNEGLDRPVAYDLVDIQRGESGSRGQTGISFAVNHHGFRERIDPLDR